MTETTAAGDLHICSLCGAGITPQELKQGLAVRVDEDHVCPLCVDKLPVDAQVRINQLRALHGLNVTVYQFVRPEYPNLACYTFTTSAQVLHHRRTLKQGQVFDAPLIGSRQGDDKPAEPHIGPSGASESGNLDRRFVIAALITVPALILLAVIALFNGDDETSDDAHPKPTNENPGPTLEIVERTRKDYPQDPFTAWTEAEAELTLDHPVLREIAETIIAQRHQELQKASTAMDEDKLLLASDLISRTRLPDHPFFRSLQDRSEALQRQLRSIREARTAAQAQAEAEAKAAEEAEAKRLQDAERQADTETATSGDDTSPPDSDDSQPAETGTEQASWIFSARDLSPDAIPAGWQRVDDQALQLVDGNGSLSRSIRLPKGNYRVWVHLRGDAPSQGQASVMLGRSSAVLGEAQVGRSYQWVAFAEGQELVVSNDGDVPFVVTFLQPGWTIVRFVIADARLPAPGAKHPTKDIPPVDWTPVAPPPPVQVDPEPEPDVRIAALARSGLVSRTIFEQDSSIANGFPGNAGPLIYASAKQETKRFGKTYKGHMARFPLPESDLSVGGLAVLLFPWKENRKKVEVYLEDGSGRLLSCRPLDTSKDTGWTVFTIKPPPKIDANKFAIDQVVAVHFSDVSRLNSFIGFLVAKIAVVGPRAPTPEDLGLRPPALLPINDAALAARLEQVTKARRLASWQQDFQPAHLRLLAGDNLLSGTWKARVRDGLEESLGANPPNKSVAKLIFHDPWLDQAFIFDPKLLMSEDHHLVVVASGGKEFQIGLDVDQAVNNFWRKMVEVSLESGVLPVVVLGPDKVEQRHQAACEQLWPRLEAMMAKEFPGIPVIDLRGFPITDAGHFGKGSLQHSASTIASGYHELKLRIERLQQAARK